MRHSSLLQSAVVLVLAACGPDASSLTGAEDVDTDEAVATTEGELTSSSRAGLWFPMQTGNTWTYESTQGSTRTVRLGTVSNGMGELSGLLPASAWVGVSGSSSTTLMRWDGSTNQWQSWLRFGFAKTAWSVGSEPCTGARFRRSATGSTVATPAGAFTDTRTIAVEQVSHPTAFCAPPAFSELTFAAGVGLVAFRTGRGERFVLRSATVDGKRVPVANGTVTASVTLDKASYVNTPNTIRCVTTPCPSNEKTAVARVAFTVTNGSASSQTWNFRTGCQVEVELVSSSGLVVKRLSDEQACTMALTSVTLASGQSRTWNAELPLADRDGLQLDGTFTARARLIPSANAGSAPVATRSLSVRIGQ
ncbi:MAG: BsuPI-related putative proteinase inhibitor [Myxococcaceae bacterium]|jgi:hypothetical protein|nr:BsuPI-related putative proteinase inhibitor [Myxococcaceae bacterium]